MNRPNLNTAALALIACLSLAATPARGQERPDFSKPEVLQKILGEAVAFEHLQMRTSGGRVLAYHGPDLYTGWYKGIHGNGKVREIGHVKDGKKEGSIVSWHENGEKKQEGTFKDGKKEGPFASWYKNGEKKKEGTFKDGKPEGLIASWHDNGKKSMESNYKDGKPEGAYSKWHANGKKQQEGTYRNGKLAGVVTVWDEDGAVLEQIRYKDGVKISPTTGVSPFSGTLQGNATIPEPSSASLPLFRVYPLSGVG